MNTPETTPTNVVTTAGSLDSSREGSDIHDNPDYIPPAQADMMLMDVTNEKLHGEISDILGVKYLSPVASSEHQVAPLSCLETLSTFHPPCTSIWQTFQLWRPICLLQMDIMPT
ncbi:hypothetical protein IV203_003983 [Nitzschia inconspicua]|uniref:Uncharacterized protein n=1 Tax=Nitzschia inconspicua TaxID=303405 RepID=A0A9K3PPA3_9STRA|nr:hypothetical protein IV203_003983 [Nitzschia inconspicua]